MRHYIQSYRAGEGSGGNEGESPADLLPGRHYIRQAFDLYHLSRRGYQEDLFAAGRLGVVDRCPDGVGAAAID